LIKNRAVSARSILDIDIRLKSSAMKLIVPGKLRLASIMINITDAIAG
jgi:hypothetical protein